MKLACSSLLFLFSLSTDLLGQTATPRGQVTAEIEAVMKQLKLERALLLPANPSLGRTMAGPSSQPDSLDLLTGVRRKLQVQILGEQREDFLHFSSERRGSRPPQDSGNVPQLSTRRTSRTAR